MDYSGNASEYDIIKQLIQKNKRNIIEHERIIKNKHTEIHRLEVKLFKICNHEWVKDLNDRCSRCSVCIRCGLPNLPNVYA